MTKVRTRYAPSPTGPQHIGGIRTALFAYLFARKNGGDLVLRIEDTDQTRYVEGAEEYIYESLEWSGIIPDESPVKGGPYAPYRQSERKDIYGPYAEQLVESGHAYYAFDTEEELEAEREKAKKQGVPSWKYDSVTRQYLKNSLTLPEDEVKERVESGMPYTIRFQMPRKEEVKFEDEIRGWVSFHSNQLDDKILLKSDGMPSYHLANVVDDHLMEITHVIRGEEWLPSAPLHVMMYRAFGWEMPRFAHLPLILNPDGKGKLSKRVGDKYGFPVFPKDWMNYKPGESITGYKEMGFFPEAFINMLAFLGWHPGNSDKELYSLEELIDVFSLDRIHKAGARFDWEKAKWFNQQYFKLKTPEELAEMVAPLLKGRDIEKGHDFVTKFCELLVDRVTFLKDFTEQGQYFFEAPEHYDEKTIRKKWKEGKKEHIPDLIEAIKKVEDFQPALIETAVKTFMEDQKLGFGDVLPFIRNSVTGIMQGPPIFETMVLIGREESVQRMEAAIPRFDEIAQKQTT